MASIANDPNGLKRILFINQDGKRKVIRLGKVDKRQATTIKLHVEALAQRKRSPSLGLSDATASWLVDLDDDLRDKLAAVGLIDPPKRATLGPFVTDYIAKRVPLVEAGKLKPDTLRIERVTRDCLIDFLGADKRLRDISEGDAEDFRDWMLSKGGRPLKRCGPETVVRGRTPLSEATTRKRCSIASKFFRYAVRHGLVGHNPF